MSTDPITPLHYRAPYAVTWTPCQVRASQVAHTQDRDRVTCPRCLEALTEARKRSTDPEARGR